MIELAIGLKQSGQKLFFFFPRGNISKEQYLLKKMLSENGFTYVFLDYVPSVHYKKDNKIEEKVFHDAVNCECLVQMKEYVKKWNIDIIHTNSLTHLIGAMLSIRTRKPHVWHIREVLEEDYGLVYDNKLHYRFALRKAGRVICISDYVRKSHRNILNKKNVIILKDGFDTGKYILHKGYQKQKDVYNVIICGLIQEGKGQLDAVKAMDYLAHEYGMKNIHLWVVGDGSKPYCEKIRSYIELHNLRGYIDMIPFQEDLSGLRRNSDIALMCSKSEAFGRVTVESMLSGNLVIGADASGTKEIIRDGINGYLYEPGNAHALCEKIYDVVKHWDRQERIVKNAKKYAIQHYDVGNYTEKILTIYDSLIKARG